MIDPAAMVWALAAVVTLAVAGWIHSVRRHNVNVVDAMWPLFFVTALVVYLLIAPDIEYHGRRVLVTVMLLFWAVRLALHLAVRNHGQAEDRRYAAIRARNEPGFTYKSIYLVFGLQAVLAWNLAAPLAVAASGGVSIGLLDGLGAVVWVFGMVFETVADWQLMRFKADPANHGRVMDRGLWRYTRHPNYFGEACIWWGFWVVACAAGGAWTLYAPVLMTVLLLKVSGVALLEKDIAERRPGYRDYVRHTNAFLPGPNRRLP